MGWSGPNEIACWRLATHSISRSSPSFRLLHPFFCSLVFLFSDPALYYFAFPLLFTLQAPHFLFVFFFTIPTRLFVVNVSGVTAGKFHWVRKAPRWLRVFFFIIRSIQLFILMQQQQETSGNVLHPPVDWICMSSVQFDGNFAAFLHQMRFSSNSFHVFCDSRRSPTFFQTKKKIY